MKQPLTGNEKFTAEFTSEELGFFALGLQALVQTMQMAAFKSNDVQVYDHFKQTQEKADALAQKIADIMGVDLEEES